MFNPKVSPLFQKKLSWGMRILYSSGVWSYLCAAISTPTFIIIPLVSPLFPTAPPTPPSELQPFISLALSSVAL